MDASDINIDNIQDRIGQNETDRNGIIGRSITQDYSIFYNDININIDKIQTRRARNIADCNEILSGTIPTTTFSIYHTNIRSLKKNIHPLRRSLSKIYNKFSIIVVTETFQIKNVDELEILNYEIMYNCGDVNKNDGTLIYVKKDIIIYPYKVFSFGQVKVISLDFCFSGKKGNVLAVYRPNPTCPHEFNTNLNEYLRKNELKKFDINIVIGDINMNLFGTSRDTLEYINILKKWGYASAINMATREQGKSSSLIDHILFKTNIKPESLLSIVLHEAITDHYPIMMIIYD